MADVALAGPVTGEALVALREQVRGRVVIAEDEGYDEARGVHNGMFDRRPLAVLMAEQPGDVIAGVQFAREHGLDLSVRGGMHSAPGFGTNDGGLVIDMSQMRTVRVDPRNKTARATLNNPRPYFCQPFPGNALCSFVSAMKSLSNARSRFRWFPSLKYMTNASATSSGRPVC